VNFDVLGETIDRRRRIIELLSDSDSYSENKRDTHRSKIKSEAVKKTAK